MKLEQSPKCHPKIAGKGIEYGCGLSKMCYRRSPYSSKQNKSSFQKLIKVCTDNRSILNMEQMQSCSRRARNYTVLYKAVEALNLNGLEGSKSGLIYNKHAILEDSMKLYRKLRKPKKRHKCVLENQMFNLRKMEKECCVIDIEHDSKE